MRLYDSALTTFPLDSAMVHAARSFTVEQSEPAMKLGLAGAFKAYIALTKPRRGPSLRREVEARIDEILAVGQEVLHPRSLTAAS